MRLGRAATIYPGQPIAWLVRLQEAVTIRCQQQSVAAVVDAILSNAEVAEVQRALAHCRSSAVRRIAHRVLELRTSLRREAIDPICKLSVVVPHYNHANHLAAALCSLANQSILPDEVIVVDDASKDVDLMSRTLEMFRDRLPLRCIRNSRRLGSGLTRQIGAEASNGDVLVMHDADDVSHPERMAVTRTFFKRNPEACQLNVGFWRFIGEDHSILPDLLPDEVAKYPIGLDEIDHDMRCVLLEQRFSIPTPWGTRFGGYGTRTPRSVTSGHVAYPRYIASVIKWGSPGEAVFTPYEDYEFNCLLFLTTRASFEIVTPLVGYRQGSSTNLIRNGAVPVDCSVRACK